MSGLNNSISSIHNYNLILYHKMSSWSGAKTLSLRVSGCNAINYAAGGYNTYDQQYFGDAAHSTLFIVEEIST